MKGVYHKNIQKIKPNQAVSFQDQLAVEEPLEIRLIFQKEGERVEQSISITMRTPGNDAVLALGFLYTEGIIDAVAQVKNIAHQKNWNPEAQENIILVELTDDISVDLKKLERHFYTTSSCGVCGKSSIEALHMTKTADLPENRPVFQANLIKDLPNRLRAQQMLFENTGGIHAAALFDTDGKLCLLQEDVGRHNAVDKLIGAALQADLLPLQDYLILVSGRASFELVQKALMADIPILAAVGAPSSLAVQLAEASGMSLLGFVRADSFNIYTHAARIAVAFDKV